MADPTPASGILYIILLSSHVHNQPPLSLSFTHTHTHTIVPAIFLSRNAWSHVYIVHAVLNRILSFCIDRPLCIKRKSYYLSVINISIQPIAKCIILSLRFVYHAWRRRSLLRATAYHHVYTNIWNINQIYNYPVQIYWNRIIYQRIWSLHISSIDLGYIRLLRIPIDPFKCMKFGSLKIFHPFSHTIYLKLYFIIAQLMITITYLLRCEGYLKILENTFHTAPILVSTEMTERE